MKDHILKLIEAVWETPAAQQWREAQTAKVVARQKGTPRERHDKDGNPAPYWGISGFHDSFEYSLAVSGYAGFTLTVRCLQTNEVWQAFGDGIAPPTTTGSAT